MSLIPKPTAFEWDKGNIDKNWQKHGVRNEEAEDAFFDEEKVISKDVPHAGKEERYILLGKTKLDRLLFVVFTVRDKRVRIISARDANKKGVKIYEEET